MNLVISGLLQDHALIHDALLALSMISKPPGKNVFPTEENVLDFLDELQFFIEDLHFAKEESVFFPWLIARGVKDRGGPLAAMMADHIQARGYLYDLIESLEDGAETSSVSQLAEKFVTCMAAHLRKEEEILFPMAVGLMTAQDEAALVGQLSELQVGEIDPSLPERIRKWLVDLKLH